MTDGGLIYFAKKGGETPGEKIYMRPDKANRHGFICGATGPGKSVTLKVLAESFSNAGVPVFLADVKGDLAGMCRPGQDSADMHQKGNGYGQGFQHLPDIKTLAVFDGGSHTVSAAQTDECVAYIENAGNHDTGSTQKTLGKGNDENADVIAGMVQNIKGLLLFIGMTAHKPACCHIEDTTAQTQKGENQKVR